jgi:hypothetical protein
LKREQIAAFMKYLVILFAFLLTAPANHANNHTWGKTGHRVVGDIAEQYLSEDAAEAVNRILGDESMAIASTWMDEIRSDSDYDYTNDWHWVSIPDGMTYAETEKNPNGDLINAIRTITTELESGELSPEKETEHLRMLIHLIGDVHTPLHVGTGEDRGGNEIRVRSFWESSNLHRVWDSGMIDEQQLSYSELSASINYLSEEEIGKLQSSDLLDWAQESIALREQVYDLPKDKNINYEYMYRNWETVEKRLLQAGIRLAGVLNEIYG